jgi:hypothetical protein
VRNRGPGYFCTKPKLMRAGWNPRSVPWLSAGALLTRWALGAEAPPLKISSLGDCYLGRLLDWTDQGENHLEEKWLKLDGIYAWGTRTA